MEFQTATVELIDFILDSDIDDFLKESFSELIIETNAIIIFNSVLYIFMLISKNEYPSQEFIPKKFKLTDKMKILLGTNSTYGTKENLKSILDETEEPITQNILRRNICFLKLSSLYFYDEASQENKDLASMLVEQDEAFNKRKLMINRMNKESRKHYVDIQTERIELIYNQLPIYEASLAKLNELSEIFKNQENFKYGGDILMFSINILKLLEEMKLVVTDIKEISDQRVDELIDYAKSRI